MKYFSTFSGIGGMELGIGAQHECVGYSEKDRFAVQIYQAHFPTHKNYGDITTIDATALPDFDLLVGGFPCQAFSVAGKRRGFEDTRGTLFFDLARILRAKRPRLFLFENVKGLLSHDSGKTFRTIIATIDELGYDAQWQVLNSKNHGVPQNRERVFIAGHLRGTPRPEVFPLEDADRSHPEADAAGKVIRETASTLTARQFASWNGNYVEETPVIIAGNQRGEVREMHVSGALQGKKSSKQFSYLVQKGRGKNKGGAHAIAPTITGKSYQDNNHVVSAARRGRDKGAVIELRKDGLAGTLRATTGGSTQPMVAYTLKARADSGIDKKHPQTLIVERGGGAIKVPEATKQGYAIAAEGDSINLSVMNSKTRRGRVGKGIAQTLDTGMQLHTLQGARIRRLTPVECERLQGFPDNWTKYGKSSRSEKVDTEGLELISDTQRYKTLGNAVTVNVIRDIMKEML